MKKKIFFIAAILVLLPMVVSAQEKRIGIELGHPNTALTFEYNSWNVKGGYDFTSGKQFIFGSLSYTIINSRPIVGPLAGSVGAGIFARYEFKHADFDTGVNIPLSLEYPLMDGFLELFVEVAPGLELLPKPAFTFDSTCFWLGCTVRID
ncbi:MAG: hypothetical protein MJ215_07480 [Spirochaetia bacterium]|nr:hypothetical protein [Spirochaetia bacterium]